MATAIAEPPHLATDLKTLCPSTVAAEWRPPAEQATRQRQAPADYRRSWRLEVTGRRERRPTPHSGSPLPHAQALDAHCRPRRSQTWTATRSSRSSAATSSPTRPRAHRARRWSRYAEKRPGHRPGEWPAAQHDYRVRFVTAAELVTRSVEAAAGPAGPQARPAARFDVVILDDPRCSATCRVDERRRRPAIRLHQPRYGPQLPGSHHGICRGKMALVGVSSTPRRPPRDRPHRAPRHRAIDVRRRYHSTPPPATRLQRAP